MLKTCHLHHFVAVISSLRLNLKQIFYETCDYSVVLSIYLSTPNENFIHIWGLRKKQKKNKENILDECDRRSFLLKAADLK